MTASRASKRPRAATARSAREAKSTRAWVPFVACGALALGVRLLFLAQLRGTPFFSHLFSDSQIYLTLARDILHGQSAPRAFFMSPLYPFLLAGVLQSTGDAQLWMRLVQCLLGTGTVLVIYRIAERVGNRRAGVAAAVLAALFPPLFYFDAAILIETWVTALAALQLLALLGAWTRGRRRDFAAAGLCLGLLVVFRASLGAFVIPYAVFAVVRSHVHPVRRSLLPYAAAALLCVLPWTLRNAVVEGVFAPVTASDGINLYAGNNERASGFYTAPPGVDLASDPDGRIAAERETGHALSSTELSAYWRDRAWSWIRSDPGGFMVLSMKKLLLQLHPGDVEQLGVSMAFIRKEYATVLDLPLPGFAVIFPLALFGFIAGMKRRDDPMLLLLLFALAVFGATALFFVSSRLRLPAMPALLAVAGFGVDRILRAVSDRNIRPILAPLLGAVAVAAAVFLAQPAVPGAFNEEYNRLGQIAFNGGRYAEAEGFYRRSLDEGRRSVTVLNLGNALAAQGKTAQADQVYADLLAREPDNHLARFNRGNLRMQTGDAAGAREDWLAALRLRPDFAPGWRNLGMLYVQGGNASAAIHYLERYVACERDPAAREAMQRYVARLRQARAPVLR